MDRTYLQWYSPALQKNMELLVFGHTGASVVFFPARMGRFYDYENWKIIEALRPKIEAGYLQIYCVDSNDSESFYHPDSLPYQRIQRHIQYERYILDEVLPLVRTKNPGSFMIAAGCSLGAYHAINITLRHPGVFKKAIAMSGRYDLTRQAGHYSDLLQGYWDEHVYFNMPIQYLPNLNDQHLLTLLRQTVVISAVGKDDVLLESNLMLHHTLAEKGIHSNLHLWEHEAHKAKAWQQMVKVYF